MNTSRRNFLEGMLGVASMHAFPASAEALADHNASSNASLALDPLRPQYHLLPARNWMNDPNGPIYWKGKYHMFFQYNPHDAVWGDMHWAHAVSEDMIHWMHLPIAIAPSAGGADEEGVYSGTAFVHKGRVGMMYTGVKASRPEDATIRERSWRETQCIAIADNDELSTFSKWSEPVISSPPGNLQVNGFRDPSPWKQGDWWYTPIASGFPNVGGALLLYRSKDLRTWEYLHVFAERKPSFEAYMPWDVWECPEFFALGDRHVLIFSTMGKAFWQCGQLDEEKMVFHPERQGILDYGGFYAPKTQLDAHGKRILWGWIQEARPVAEYQASGWSGMMSLPRVLTVAADGALRYRVADEATSLRRNERHFSGTPGADLRMPDCCGEALYRLSTREGRFSIDIAGDGESTAWMSVGFDPKHPEQILIDLRPVTLEREPGKPADIHIHMDSSVIELLVDDQVAWTKRFYYAGAQRGATLRYKGTAEGLEEVTVWSMEPISRDRLTT
jgi:beta-fructofuranosidase